MAAVNRIPFYTILLQIYEYLLLRTEYEKKDSDRVE